MRRRQALLAALLGASLLAAGTAAAQGSAIVIGGALKYDNTAVWKRIVDEAGGSGARFAVFGTASAHPERAAASIVAALNAQGAQAEFIPVAPKLKGVDLQKNLVTAQLPRSRRQA